jgi:hypothetical protein
MSSSSLEAIHERGGTGRLQMWSRARRWGWQADHARGVIMNNP